MGIGDQMAEKLYTIPVNDAFQEPCECPICRMKKTLEDNAIDYTLGSSYMEADTRMQTNKLGFCKDHMAKLNQQENRLGLALILKTHFDQINKETKKRASSPFAKGGLFKKTPLGNPFTDYLDQLEKSCFVCERIAMHFDRYIITIFHLYANDREFAQTYKNCLGFCNEHTSLLLKMAPNELPAKLVDEFCNLTIQLYLDNMQRVTEDLDWFTCKFDYKYTNEPWKNAKDAIPRAIIKSNGLIK